MEIGMSHLHLQLLQIAIGLVVAYMVWQNGKRQVEDLDKKLDKIEAKL